MIKLDKYLEKHGNRDVDEKQLNQLLGIKGCEAWKPVEGETYWCINSDSDVVCLIYRDNWDGDNKRLKTGNCYQTEAQAQLVADYLAKNRGKINVAAELQAYADEHNDREIDWKDECHKHRIVFYHDVNSLDVDWYVHTEHQNSIYFTSPEIAEAAIRHVGVARIAKECFGVDDYDGGYC